jgi:hypothetical protein
MFVEFGQYLPSDAPFGTPDRRVYLAKALINPETEYGVGRLSLKEASPFQLFHGLRVDADQDLMHDVSHHAEENEKHHLTQGFHFSSWELSVSSSTGFFRIRVFGLDFRSEIKRRVFSFKFS